MKISKTRFLNYLRCTRFAALFEIYKQKEQAIVSFSESLDDLISEENKYKKQVLLENMFEYDEENDEEINLIEQENPQLDVMMPYYQKIEELSANKIRRLYGGDIVYSMDTSQQKRFETEINGYHFYAFLDGYQEDDKKVRIVESKATTSKKYTELSYTIKRGEPKKFVFVESPDGILRLRHELGLDTDDKYFEILEKLKNRMDKMGRYVYDIAYQRFIIEKIHLKKPTEYYLAVLNREYQFDGRKDENNEPIYSDDIITLIDVTWLTEQMMPLVEADCETVISHLDYMQATHVPLGKHCQRNDSRQCIFYDLCHGEVLPKKNSVFTLFNLHHGLKDEHGEKHYAYDLINEGMVGLTDVPYNWLREENKIQYEAVVTHEPQVKKDVIKSLLSKLEYPLYHLDFETFPGPLPRFKGERPYDQSVFQFSLHIEREPGVCHKDQDHIEFLATDHDDHRKELVELLINSIGDKGHVIAYNYGFEKSRMKELANIFPEYHDKLMDLVNRTFDLRDLLKGNKKQFGEEAKWLYYHEGLQGSYSIKKVLPIFVPELTYKGLDVANGVDAVVTYAKFPTMNKEEFKLKKQALLYYCKQDTWAMVAILDKLRQMV